MQVLETRCDWVVTGSGGNAVNAWGGAGNATALPALVNGDDACVPRASEWRWLFARASI